MRTAYEIVKAHYDANERRDMDGMLADIAPDCQWTEMDGFPCAGTYVGPQEVFKNVFQALGDIFGRGGRLPGHVHVRAHIDALAL